MIDLMTSMIQNNNAPNRVNLLLNSIKHLSKIIGHTPAASTRIIQKSMVKAISIKSVIQ
jgi:hypothetical protein